MKQIILSYIYINSLHRIKNDDILIWQKGVKSLSDYELEQACTCRGNLGFLLKQQMDLKVCFASVKFMHILISYFLDFMNYISFSFGTGWICR